MYGARDAYNVTVGVTNVVDVNKVDFDADLSRLQLDEVGLDWCDPDKLQLNWSYVTQ